MYAGRVTPVTQLFTYVKLIMLTKARSFARPSLARIVQCNKVVRYGSYSTPNSFRSLSESLTVPALDRIGKTGDSRWAKSHYFVMLQSVDGSFQKSYYSLRVVTVAASSGVVAGKNGDDPRDLARPGDRATTRHPLLP